MPRLGVRVPLSPPLHPFPYSFMVCRVVSISSVISAHNYEWSLNKPLVVVSERPVEIPSSPQLVWGCVWGGIAVEYCHSMFMGWA